MTVNPEGAMGAVFGFVIGVWNFLVSVAPQVMHAACQLTEGASNAVKLGGGQ
jgi:hypothetical protein